MNQTRFLLVVSSVALLWGSVARAEPDAREWNRLKDRLNERIWQPKPCEIPKNQLREYKREGDIYVHTMQFQVKGEADRTKFKFFKKQIQDARVTCVAELIEEVKTVDQEDGTVASKYTLTMSRAEVVGGNGNLMIGQFSAAPVIKFIVKDNWDAIRKGMEAGIGAAVVATMVHPLLSSAIGLTGKTILMPAATAWHKSADRKVTPEGFIRLDTNDLEKAHPDAANVIAACAFVDNLEGAVATTKWSIDNGYTEIIVELPDTPSRSKDTDTDLVKKMIARTSLLSCAAVLPPNRTQPKVGPEGDQWDVDAGQLGILMLRGIDFDYIRGTIRVRGDRWGKLGKDDVDEKENGKMDAKTLTVAVVDRTGGNKIDCMRQFKKDERKTGEGALQLAFSVTNGTLTVVNEINMPRYMRQATLNGQVTFSDVDVKSQWLGGVALKGDIRGQFNYQQVRKAAAEKPTDRK